MNLTVSLSAASATPWPVLWAPAASAFCVTVVGLMTFWVATQQMLTARKKLQLDLYDRRLAMFEAAHKLLAQGLRRLQDKTVDLHTRSFRKKVRGAQFLLSPAIADLLDEVEWTVSGCIVLDDLDHNEPTDRVRFIVQRRALLDLKSEVQLRFARYLDLDPAERRRWHTSLAKGQAKRAWQELVEAGKVLWKGLKRRWRRGWRSKAHPPLDLDEG